VLVELPQRHLHVVVVEWRAEPWIERAAEHDGVVVEPVPLAEHRGERVGCGRHRVLLRR
jgi:hypothetical protein